MNWISAKTKTQMPVKDSWVQVCQIVNNRTRYIRQCMWDGEKWIGATGRECPFLPTHWRIVTVIDEEDDQIS